jgi:hypothetical protein
VVAGGGGGGPPSPRGGSAGPQRTSNAARPGDVPACLLHAATGAARGGRLARRGGAAAARDAFGGCRGGPRRRSGAGRIGYAVRRVRVCMRRVVVPLSRGEWGGGRTTVPRRSLSSKKKQTLPTRRRRRRRTRDGQRGRVGPFHTQEKTRRPRTPVPCTQPADPYPTRSTTSPLAQSPPHTLNGGPRSGRPPRRGHPPRIGAALAGVVRGGVASPPGGGAGPGRGVG